MIIKYYLDGVEINPPNNYQELEIQLNYDQDSNTQALSTNDFEFGVGDPSKGNDGMLICRNTLTDQTGIGVVQGKPFKITIQDNAGVIYTLFDGYVDLWKAKYERDKITASGVQSGKIDWLNDYADSFTFQYLFESGFYGKDKFIPIPYCIVKKQDAFEIAMTLVTIFIIVDKFKSQVVSVSKLIARLADPFDFTAIVELIIQIAYLVVLFASLVTLILRFLYLACPPVKYHQAMYVKDLFQIACDYMGFTFKSSILLAAPFDKLVILPEKYNLTTNTGILAGIEGDFKNNNDKTGYFRGTFGDLLRALKTMFNAKVVIDNGILYFEPWDFRLGTNGINVPYSFDNQKTFTLNYDDFYATMILSFLTDLNDRHTIQEYSGTSIQVTTTSKTTLITKMSLLRNLLNDNIPFALAKTKTELTLIESLVSDFLKIISDIIGAIVSAINAVISVVNAIIKTIKALVKALRVIGIKIKFNAQPISKISQPGIGSKISNRLGMLKMESDFVSVPKIFLIDQNSNPVNTKIDSGNQSFVNAAYLFYTYHYMRSFVSINGKADGQYVLRESDEFPFSFADYEKSLSNNSIFTDDGLQGLAMSIKFNPYKQTATCSYKVNQHYLSNLQQTIIVPDGQ